MTMRSVVMALNPMEPASWERFDTEDPTGLIVDRLGAWPANARLYDGAVVQSRDVTPDPASPDYADQLERLRGLQGPLYVVEYPADPVTAIIAAVVVVAALAAAVFLFRPKMGASQLPGSPNNELSARTNEARVGGRVPDIFGRVRAYPDLLAVPYRFFQSNQEIEQSYMCVGRGSYDLEQTRDGETLLTSIAGASATYFAPFTSPNSGDAPQLSVGTPVTDPVLSVRKMNDVNGQTLKSPNSNSVRGDDDIRFVYPDTIQRSGSEIDFTARFDPGDTVIVSGAAFSGTPGTLSATTAMRFESTSTIRFQSYNPQAAGFVAGDFVTLGSAAFVGSVAALSPYTLVWSPATFPTGHAAVLDRVKTLKLVGADPAKFYRVYHLFFKDIGTRAACWVYQSDDAAGTVNSVAVAAWVVGSGAANVGVQTVALAAQGGSGITGEATIDFGDGTTAFAAYNGTGANSALVGSPTVTGGQQGVQFVDLVGTYQVASVTTTTIVLTTPSSVNADWGKLANYPSSRTEYEVSSVSKPTAASGVNLGGTYTVLSVSSSQIVLSNPVTVNSAWGTPLQSLPGSATPFMSPSIATSGVDWVGGFVMDLDGMDRVLSNFVALQGLYQINKKGKQRANSVTVEVELTPVDDDDVPIGLAETFQHVLVGDDKSKDTVGSSHWAEPTFTGRCIVRARRITPTNLDFEGTWVDEVKWRDCYGMAPVEQEHFGDVTTVMTRTYATAGATSLKERKLSVVATRRLPQRELDGSFSTDLYPTVAMADIVAFMCTDPKIGRRPEDQVDVAQVYEAAAAIEDYFGTPEAAQFCHTFDQQDLSFEDTLATVATACFCQAYRRGSIIRMAFEGPDEDSALLFNHRNKMPGTEKRTVAFGSSSEYDGVALEYADPVDGARLTIYVPQGDESAVNPKKISSSGVASHIQAHLLAWRAWNRIRYQTTTVEFDALPEAELLVKNARVLVADNTRPDTRDGEVLSQDVLKLVLSQRHGLEDGVDYTILLQGAVAGVDAMAVYPDPDGNPYTVLLERAPAIDLVLDEDGDFRSTYAIVGPGFERTAAPFLVAETEPQDDGTIRLTATNYDARYYANDADHIDGVI